MSHGKFYSGDSPEHQPGQQDLNTAPPTGGDMLKSVYDTDNDGRVDAADTADTAGHSTTSDEATKLAGVDAVGIHHYYGTRLDGTVGFWNLLHQTSYGRLYELWLAQGFSGTATDFLLWLGLEVEYSEDGTSAWHSPAVAADKYIRFKDRATNTWSDAIRFQADDLIIQYSPDGSSGWDNTLDPGDKFIRFSVDGGDTYSAAAQFTGSDVIIEYSADGSTGWSTTYTNQKFLRFSTDGGGTYSSAILFVGTPVVIDDLGDVDTTTAAPTNGQALVFNGTEWVPGNPTAAPPAQLDGTEFIEYFETTATAADENINRADGGIQKYTMLANTTFTFDLTEGQSLTLHLNGGDTYTATWPAMTWVGGTPPTLTASDVIEFWYFDATLFGAYVGGV